MIDEPEYERKGTRIVSILNQRDGVDMTVGTEGIQAGGWYDSFVGIESVFVPWSEIDEARKVAEQSAKRAESRARHKAERGNSG